MTDFPDYSRQFRIRRLLNWLPLGLTYAFFYMGRYNLTVAKSAIPSMTKADFGIIFGVGAWVYAISFLLNGPLTDRIGGKKGMLIGALGSCLANVAMGVIVNLNLAHHLMLWSFTIVYGLNMYFQSYGAVAIVKVNAAWFHVRERGVFSGIFGTLISLGLYFAFDWGGMIVEAFPDTPWYVFYIPAFILFIFFVIDILLIKDTPEQAGFPKILVGDHSDADLNTKPLPLKEILLKVLTNKIILTIAFIEFCSGVLRNGIMHWYRIYANEIKTVENQSNFFLDNWGLLLCIAGITGGVLAGTVSDKLFQSRRAPSAGFLYAGMIFALMVMIFTLRQPVILGTIAVFISFCVIGVHGLLSGTATMDFGGKKAAATAVGLIDGFVYLGTGVQSLALGYLVSKSWSYWPIFLAPFALFGFILTLRIWNASPIKTKAQS